MTAAKANKQRESDAALLRRAIDDESISERAREAFEDMLIKLQERRIILLTDKQRSWVKEALGEPVYENLVSAGKVPRGREVPTPAVLQHRPLKPPGRA